MSEKVIFKYFEGQDAEQFSFYRIPKQSRSRYEKIRNRDIDRFPTEKDFVSEAVLSYEDRIKNTEIMAEVRELAKKIDRITIAMGW